VYSGAGMIDDNAWMARCLALRDTLRRIKPRIADGPHMLGAVGGPAIAVAAGLLLGAAERRTPVLFDGPVGAAAAVAARDYAIEVRLWCHLADDGGHPAVIAAADLLGLTPLVGLNAGLGEGATALAILPLLQNALLLSTLDS
jgi:NaMN:DMB phosphoribosyltransferase